MDLLGLSRERSRKPQFSKAGPSQLQVDCPQAHQGRLDRACCFGCLKGVSKSGQVPLTGIEALMVLTLIYTIYHLLHTIYHIRSTVYYYIVYAGFDNSETASPDIV